MLKWWKSRSKDEQTMVTVLGIVVLGGLLFLVSETMGPSRSDVRQAIDMHNTMVEVQDAVERLP